MQPNRTSGAVRLLLATLLVSSCGESGTGPGEARVTLTAIGGALIHAPPSLRLPEPLRVLALDAGTQAPQAGIEVEWQITGPATLAAGMSVTDEYGVAEIIVTSRELGTSRIVATTGRLQGPMSEFELRTIPRPTIEGISPAMAAPGAGIIITGTGFSTVLHENIVTFDGVQGAITAATSTELRVTVPPCLPARTLAVRAGVGFALSEAQPLASTGSTAGTLTIVPGDVRTFSEPSALTCIRLEHARDALYLLVTNNVTSGFGPPAWLNLHALGADPVAALISPTATGDDFAAGWETGLRLRERSLLAGPTTRELVEAPAAPVPVVGDRREFNVLNAEQGFDRIQAVARVVSDRAVLYVDEAAAGTFTDADLLTFADLFDDPIHATIVGVYGEPSDIDDNDRVLIVFTPRVNALTPRSSGSFVAGFFYGCDLVSRSRCSGTNRAEVFYSIVPDATGEWSDRRSLTTVMASVPPVLAHEFQHMINYAQRGFSSEELWLSEALAHMAEDLVGEVFLERQDDAAAATFFHGNRARARQYLFEPEAFSLVAREAPGTLGMRGSGWLFLQYVRGHYGGDELLRRLTSGTRSGVANMTAETGQSWEQLITDFGLALWVDDAPELEAVVAVRYTFADFSPRDALYTAATPIYPLQPAVLSWTGFSARLVVPPSSQAYRLVRAPDAPAAGALNFALVETDGAPLATGSGVRLTIFRVR